ncbi:MULTISPECIES: tryptophan-rich sensory protein [unclassified Spirillospora]
MGSRWRTYGGTAAGAALVPYAVWCAFATALNGDIAYRNRRDRRR